MKRLALVFALFLALPAVGRAHFLWLTTLPAEAGRKVQVYFGEEVGPDDPALLDKVLGTQVWSLGGRGEPTLVSLAKGEESLEGFDRTSNLAAPLILQYTYGVITRGNESFLLQYSGKTYPSPLSGTWSEVADAERLPLEIIPRREDGKFAFKVKWQGTSLAGAEVAVAGPGLTDLLKGTTDDSGTFRCQLPSEGEYSIRARHVVQEEGEHEGQAYRSVRHYSTLTLQHVLANLRPEAHALPPLPEGLTSFGGAVAREHLYLFGGNYGDAHAYSEAGQSGDLWVLNLREPKEWRKVTGGPKRQGLAMASYQDQVYRVGGFAAENREGEPEVLRSQADFARLNQDSLSWESLPNLPEARSSHDVAVVGNHLYVVGGWNMQDSGRSAHWHQNLLACNLDDTVPAWKELAPPPFERRALAAAAWRGKLVCIGGMSKAGGPTTEVAIYDPRTNSWSAGPRILGGPMDGFGCSAFSVGDQLIVTTITGSIQRLSDDGTRWEYVGQVEHDRFFHRILPWNDDRLVIVGGANMGQGKVLALEVLRPVHTGR